MRWLVPSELSLRPPRVAALGSAIRLHAGLVLLAALCLLITPALLAAGLFLRRQRRQRFARFMIFRLFRDYFALMEKTGALQLDLSALDALRHLPAAVIAPNHPSMIDAALVLSRLPDLTCIMKADILHNVLFGSGARMAGYITNDPARKMLRAAADSLRAGSPLLLFPEGTRTRQLPLNELQRTIGVIAKNANAPVQTVIIETSTAFLGKGWPLLRVPAMPMVYRVRLGKRFAPPADATAFSAELEAYFRAELAGARLPVLPAHPASR